VDLAQVPDGFQISTPLQIEEDHDLVSGSLLASPDAKSDADWSRMTISAMATIDGKVVKHSIPSFGPIKVGPAPKFIAHLTADKEGRPQPNDGQPRELILAPGQTVKAWIRVERHQFDELINFDIHGLPHGVIVDDIGLNGVQVRTGETERALFLRCAPWVADQDCLCHTTTASARAAPDSAGLQTSAPLLLKIRRPTSAAVK
jgi:hypothetical protein